MDVTTLSESELHIQGHDPRKQTNSLKELQQNNPDIADIVGTVDQAHETVITDNSFSYIAHHDIPGKLSKHDKAPLAMLPDSNTVESVLFRADQILMASESDNLPVLDLPPKEPNSRSKLF